MRRLPAVLLALVAALLGVDAACGAGTVTRPAAQGPAPAAAPTPARPPAAAPAGPTLMSPAEIDRLVEATWAAARVQPAAAADDAELLRRTTLDAIGRVPTLDEAESFLGDRAPDKRARLVDRLLA